MVWCDDTTESQKTNLLITLKCKICNLDAFQKRQVLKCDKCKCLVHFQCTQLPIYMLYTLSASTKKYVCEGCAEIPENFIINNVSPSENNKNTTNTTEFINPLEMKLNDLCDIMRKYDFPGIADKIQNVYSNLEKMNNNLKENVALLTKASMVSHRNTDEDSKICILEEKLLHAEKEVFSLRASERLLFESDNAKDNNVSSLTHDKEKHIKLLNEMNQRVQDLQGKINQYGDIELINQELGRENNVLKDRLNALRNLDEVILSKEELINATKEQLKEEHARSKIMESNLTAALNNVSRQNTQEVHHVNNLVADENQVSEGTPKSPNVVLFHDSLCKHINNTILRNEGVTTTKIWAPTLKEIQEKADDMEHTDVIVIQALTREISKDCDTEDVVDAVTQTVNKCLLKSDKVVVSSIINREDDDILGVKAEMVNANVKYRYINNPNVLVCNNDNLHNRKYRTEDKLHLSEHGTSLFATNLKYKISEALDITVAKKRRTDNNQRRFRNNRRNNDRNGFGNGFGNDYRNGFESSFAGNTW